MHMILHRTVCSSLLAMLFLSPEAHCQERIKGHVEAGDVFVKLMRPVKPAGLPLPSAAKHPLLPKAELDALSRQSENSLSSMIDSNDFMLGVRPEEFARQAISDDKAGAVTKDGELSESDRELIIAWESWHKAVSAAIYRRWRIFGTVAGEAKVKLVVSREGDISSKLISYDYDAGDDLDIFGSKELFEANVVETLKSLNHDSVLVFPVKSKRQEVVLNTRFASHMGLGLSGYSWKRGDVERVQIPTK